MNRAIEFHDSTISAVIDEGRSVVIKLDPAYIHESAGKPSIDRGLGFIQEVHLRISEPSLRPVLDALPCTIMDGSLIIGGTCHDNVIPLPMIYAGPTEFRCKTDVGGRLVIKGSGVVAVLKGERKYLEEYPGESAT